MANTMKKPHNPQVPLRRIAVLFSGGPAPAANAVISTCAVSFLRNDVEVLGIRYGYSKLMEFSDDRPLSEGEDYVVLDHNRLKRSRNAAGIMIGTARANPGKLINSPEHLGDPERTAPMQTVYDALCSLGVDALVSIGGDDTLKTANKFSLFQENLPEEKQRIRVVHVPKTIDNDYKGIDFTFGYFTAVETLAGEIRNLVADAESDGSYFLVETMGRSAGWLAYGASIAGEASFVISVEDIVGDFAGEETEETESGPRSRKVMHVDRIVSRIVDQMVLREDVEGKPYGVVVVAEGLVEYLDSATLKDVPRDAHGHISVAQVDLARMLAGRVETEYAKRSGRKRRVKPIQLGYESRCARPHAFDVLLGSQLGVGAYRALMEEDLSSVMISTSGQLDLQYIPFEKLVDPDTLVTVVRFVDTNSDFHKLARFLETHADDL